jgi:hypothetical protein
MLLFQDLVVEMDKKINFHFVSLFQLSPMNVLKSANAFFSLSFAKLIAKFRRN